MKKPLRIRIIAALLIILYFYTSVSKVLDYPEFERQMRNQAFPAWSAHLIVWLLPPVEIVVVLLLLAPGMRLSGFYLSIMLMFGFTTYIGLVLTGFFDRRPCSCGGVISSMSFESHFFFNLLFMALSALGAYLCRKQGPDRQHHQAASGTGGSLPGMRQG